MTNAILEFAMRNRPLVLLGACGLLGAGLWSALHLPIDAVPDITGVQVQALADDSVVATLTDDFSDGSGKGCANGIAKKAIMALRQHPEQYYVNVLTGDPATGAIRGTLHK